ncbi:Piso0_000239 [Millerozyma farinosa CBS 7064]|uniref:Histone acetyltransferase type B catalytic subunit n=1 Tax=Pichia sorbitophila (strain ATCC MYA-4447 / BCRC 22081 / CBS 7064 / NBRC 10061 / NRRL Y-12695) TaxID=559304 RepID=G8YUW6_PICSO|nr:Piso0_000239 [Millerozyma farinosa CBS 7064]
MGDNKLSITAASLQPELWTASANEALQIFVTDSEGKALNFQPTFTYPIFGDSEQIFGYKDLVIFLCFDHYSFYPFLNVKYSEKLEDTGIEDPKKILDEFLPESTVFKDEIKWRDAISKEHETYKIPGQAVGSEFVNEGARFGIYKIDLQSEAGLELHKRLQILVLLFIEAGSYIDSKDKLWDLYVLYELPSAEKKEPSIIGFCTAYNYWKYGGHEKFDSGVEEIRKKISQFVVLPMYQGRKLGGSFYNQLYNEWLADERIKEIVVEDPNESFDDMRDRCDLKRLAQAIGVSAVKLPLDTKWSQEVRTSQKLEKRQFSRLLEMFLIYQREKQKSGKLPGTLKVSTKDIRLFIKRRLFEKNREILESLDEPTRIDKLQTAYVSLDQDYIRIIEGLELPLTPGRVDHDGSELTEDSEPLQKKQKI